MTMASDHNCHKGALPPILSSLMKMMTSAVVLGSLTKMIISAVVHA